LQNPSSKNINYRLSFNNRTIQWCNNCWATLAGTDPLQMTAHFIASVSVLPEIVRSKDFEIPGLRHGFCGRRGGVSTGQFESLNLSRWVGDEAAAVETNWNAISPFLPSRRIVLCEQVHGTIVHQVGPGDDPCRKKGDGAVTASSGVTLGVFTADCVPILMVDPGSRVVGAFHAGWRGTLHGIARSAVEAMEKAGAVHHRIRVALGPAIGRCCYEVDEALGCAFGQAFPDSTGRIRAGRPGKAMLDLRGILYDQFQTFDISPRAITQVGPCTRCARDRFFSRRAAGGSSCGLQLSFIGYTEVE
jgi:YfiH family protein